MTRTISWDIKIYIKLPEQTKEILRSKKKQKDNDIYLKKTRLRN